jgi:hypothetical protein
LKRYRHRFDPPAVKNRVGGEAVFFGSYQNEFEYAAAYGYGCLFMEVNSSDAVPGPAAVLMAGSGLIGLAGYGRRKVLKK